MVTIEGILGQAAPPAAALTQLYKVPNRRKASVQVIITNRSAEASFRIAVAINNAADSPEQYIAYDKVISANDTGITAEFNLSGYDTVRVYSNSSNISFNCTGIEEDE